ncbi:MAG: hypothetical protein A3F46_08945 [Legionellales bacterium RIFCSPHIGHO2_12_FULL_42_9]|nr:MAG: hypothetical protein A3F46_08945 [Legionellales bacterium RIFCSPHIGHO2_12_FULL_42_9]
MSCITLLPRLIRLRDAPDYLGMDRHRFNEEVRPSITEVPIGSQGIAFDRLDLDAWVDDYKRCSGRPAATKQRSLEKWDENERQESIKKVRTGKSTRQSLDTDFAKALVLATSKRLRSTSQDVLRK